jgi:signal transduction histidine kinase
MKNNNKETENKEAEKKEEKNKKSGNRKTERKIRFSMPLQVVIFMLTVLSIVVLTVGVRIAVVKSVSAKLYNNVKEDMMEQADYLQLMIDDINSEEPQMYNSYDCIYTLAQSMGGRIILLNNSYKVTFDSYNLYQDKYVIDKHIYDIVSGTNTYYESDDDFDRYIFPISTDETGNIDMMAVIVYPKSDVNAEIDVMSRQSDMIVIIFIIIGVFCATVISYLSVRDILKLNKQLKGMKEGYLGLLETGSFFKETGSIIADMNDIFSKAQSLEESRQEFVSNVSHELKTPITSMKVLSESLLMQENVPAEMYREFMNDIVSEIDREAQIISDLLTLVKTDKGQDSLNIENVDINELMDVILKRLKPLAEKRNIEITFESFREVKADVDKVKFTLAISNLIENGIKYNIDGGYIRVSLNADHKSLYIKVADTGVGIPEDCVEHIFERFYRVDKARSRDTGGTGLGLAITKNIILMHKGNINVYSEPGKGTTFTVRVPMNYKEEQ